MNEKSFIRKAQKLTARAVNLKNIEIVCALKRYETTGLLFELSHLSNKYIHGNSFITVYIDYNTEKSFEDIEEFISAYERGESALIKKEYLLR